MVDGRPAGIDDVVVAGDDLWWTTAQYLAPDRIEIGRRPKAGGSVEVVAAGVAAALGDPQVEGDAALVASPEGVLRVRAGRPPEVVVSSDDAGGAVTALAADGERLYLLVAGARHRLLAVPRAGGKPDRAGRRRQLVGRRWRSSAIRSCSSGSWAAWARAAGGRCNAVAGAGGTVRTIATGRYPDGDLAAVGTDRVVFSADGRVWIASVVP